MITTLTVLMCVFIWLAVGYILCLSLNHVCRRINNGKSLEDVYIDNNTGIVFLNLVWPLCIILAFMLFDDHLRNKGKSLSYYIDKIYSVKLPKVKLIDILPIAIIILMIVSIVFPMVDYYKYCKNTEERFAIEKNSVILNATKTAEIGASILSNPYDGDMGILWHETYLENK